MTDEQVLDLFEKHDDPVRWERPKDMDYERESKRVHAFTDTLRTRGIAGALESGTWIQDASFHSQLEVEGRVLRFSNFGSMAAFTEEIPSPSETRDVVLEALAYHGYVYIPRDLLERAYTGKNAGVTGIATWWIRYFDWV